MHASLPAAGVTPSSASSSSTHSTSPVKAALVVSSESPASSQDSAFPHQRQCGGEAQPGAAAAATATAAPHSSPPRWGVARSPTIRLPPTVVLPSTVLLPRRATKAAHGGQHGPQPSHAAGQQHAPQSESNSGTSSSSDSGTPAPHAVVLDSLVRRFRTTETRLERWRQSGMGAAGARHAATTAAPLQAKRNAPQAAMASSPSDAVPASVVHAVLERSAIVRAVQSWWHTSRREKRGPAAGGTAAAALVNRHHQQKPLTSQPISLSAPTMEWVGQAGRRLLGRFSGSLTPSSSARGERATPVEVVGLDPSPLDSVGAMHAEKTRRVGGMSEATSETHAASVPGEGSQRSGSTTSNSSSSSDSSSDTEDSLIGSTSALPAPSSVDDDGPFTLSWIRGLGRRHTLTDASARLPPPLTHATLSSAEDSFRSASRLLARSRLRFARWLRRQQRLQAAKRALSVERWRASFAPPRRQSSAEETQDAAVSDPCPVETVSALARDMLHVAPTSWERTLAQTVAPRPSQPTLETTRQARLAVQRAIAAVASTQRQLTEETKKNAVSSSSGAGMEAGQMPALPPTRQERRAREHADALAQLADSLLALSSIRTGGDGQAAQTAKECSSEASHLNPASSPSTILPSIHATFLSGSDKWEINNPAAVSDVPPRREAEEADAFRSLLVDTTHTPRDAAVRHAYEAVMQDVCGSLVRQAVESAVSTSRGAANRALMQWVERQLLRELTTAPKSGQQETPAAASHSTDQPPPLEFVGVLAHIRSGTPASLSHLHMDDADRRALASVYEREESDATAVTLESPGYTISYRQLASLRPRSWLNDQVINNYLQLLCEHVERQQSGAAGKGQAALHSIASMGTHFYAKVEAEVARRAAAGEGVRDSAHPLFEPLAANSAVLRWLRRRQHLLQPHRAFSNDSSTSSAQAGVRAVLVPVNIEAQHWALAVYYREDCRWVLYDSMSRSDRAQQRGRMILARLAHVWRECQRHFGIVTAAAAEQAAREETLLVAAPYAPAASNDGASPLDSLAPFGSVAELHRAAKRLRHQEDALAHEHDDHAAAPRRQRRGEACLAAAAAATSLPSSMLSDVEVEWFTDGFARVPQQKNGNDCGVFVCQAAWCVAQGVAVSFTQTDITLLRQVILLELLSKRMLRRYPTEHTSSSADV